MILEMRHGAAGDRGARKQGISRLGRSCRGAGLRSEEGGDGTGIGKCIGHEVLNRLKGRAWKPAPVVEGYSALSDLTRRVMRPESGTQSSWMLKPWPS